MSETTRLEVQLRTATGTAAARNLRREGIVPCNVFGHKQDPQSIQVDALPVRAILSKGIRVVDLVVDGKTDKALIAEVQWDTFNQHLIHVDFMRVDPTERVKVKVPVHLRGTAPGVLAGGILEQPHHEVTVECLAIEVPSEIVVKVGHLQLNEFIHVGDLTELPTGLQVLDTPDTVLVHITPKQDTTEDGAGEGGPIEPELIGRKAKDGEGAA